MMTRRMFVVERWFFLVLLVLSTVHVVVAWSLENPYGWALVSALLCGLSVVLLTGEIRKIDADAEFARAHRLPDLTVTIQIDTTQFKDQVATMGVAAAEMQAAFSRFNDTIRRVGVSAHELRMIYARKHFPPGTVQNPSDPSPRPR